MFCFFRIALELKDVYTQVRDERAFRVLAFLSLVLNKQKFAHFAESDPTNTLVMGVFISNSLPACFDKNF